MRKEDKSVVISELIEKFAQNKNFYLVDTAPLTANQNNSFRRECFKQGVELRVAKNSLIEKALIEAGITEDFSQILRGASSLMFSENPTLPAKLIKEFRKDKKYPELKAAFIEESLYVGDDNLETVSKIKSKQVLIGEVLSMLQAPMQNVVSGLKGQGSKIAGILKTLEERNAA